MPLDIGVGLLLGVLLSGLSTINYEFCLLIGVMASLLPDLDFVWKLVRYRRLPHSEHRDGLHYPLIVVPLLGLLGWLITPALGLIIALGPLLHFIHDSIGVGFGIKWLFPFKRNSYLFLYRAGVGTNASMPKQRMYSWNDAERAKMIKQYANPDWVRIIYFRPHPFGIFEYAVCIIGVVVAIRFS